MFVGVLRLTLHLPDPGSLKSKRHLVRSAIDRVRARFNVSIAEVAENDLWQRCVIGVSAVGNDHGFVNEVLDKVSDFVASMHGGQLLVTARDLEIVPYGDAIGEGEMRTLAEAEGAPGWDAGDEPPAPAARPRPRPRPRDLPGEGEE
jgi:uncharacterized protein YlxP (DUF503 family)